ncbi:ubiquitin carboxyl-terminal hydrolase 45 isoform X2 [Drosophila persimilis]|uniref:ubiquitin carboxyl-terminal hydrolase 45 isoform X2 n=1 Tax=Drosophila persimilis TaxID=7234 RepID=UPI000F08FA93|nr:ubiquitin carboxyl-terminal hydrolase 45 isoform X2 [Drosophila persimilis]
MGKKRQMDNHDNASSTDSGQEDSHGQTTGASGSAGAAAVGSSGADGPMTSCCQHIKKSVDAARLRRQLKATGLVYECSQCQKNQGAASGSGSGSGDLDCDFEIDSTLWLCLKCGTQLCGRSRKQHALQHYKTPHSDSHALAMNTRSFEIWCYGCDNKVTPNSRKNLLECVELVKRLAQKPPAEPPVEAPTAIAVATPSPPTITDIELKFKSALQTLGPIVPMTGGSFEDINSTATSSGGNLTAIPLPAPPGATALTSSSPVRGMATGTDSTAGGPNPPDSPKSEVERLPRVRGLTNLGNTCFFNAVMQCLAQTPFLLSVLRELSEPGEEFVLPGGTFDFKGKGSTELPIIRGTLSSWGSLTSALVNALEELQVGGGVFTPRKLFDKLCAKCPQFTGGDQHDAHELLRQLLESVRNEDLKRYQRVILQNLGYKDQDIQNVSEEMRRKCKIYGNQAGDRILRPEQVFRGFLVSTLTCQDCHSVSSRHEYFLDMSLPVAVEKPQPPQRRKPSPESSPFPISGQMQTQNQNQLQLQSPTKINTKFTTPEDGNPFAADSSSSSFYLHANQQETVGPSKSQVKKDKERERKAKRAAKHLRYKQAQKLTLKLNGNGTGSHADADSEANNELDAAGTGTGGGDGDSQTTSDGQGQHKEELISSSSTTSENSDADIEDNLVEETATTRDRAKTRGVAGGSSSASSAQGGNSSSSRFFTDTNGNAQPLGEKRDDTPENMDKDSLEEDENGIATSPLPSGISKTTTTTTTTTSAANNNEASRSPQQQREQKKEDGRSSADIVTAGVSAVGASSIRQISIDLDLPPNGVVREEAGEANTDKVAKLQLQEIATQLALSDYTLEATAATAAAASATAEGVAEAAAAAGVAAAAAAAAAAARAKRVRTYSYSDWSTTIAPRYQCEDGECSVQSCLNSFTAVELMTGQNKVGCDSCTQRLNGNDPKAKSVNTNATKQLLVSSPPAVLILHLKRFQLGPRCIFRKLTRPVSYPNMLDIAAFCGSKVKNLPNIDRKQKKLLYALYGVVEHSGGMYGGHYTAYVKVRPKVTPEDKRWKFLPHGSKAELDQDDDQLKKLEELLAKEKARELHLNSMNDSDDFTNSSSNSSTSEEFNTNPNGLGPGQQDKQEEEAANVQAPPGKWYYVSDSRVQEVSEDTALKAQAYLLFYERIY